VTREIAARRVKPCLHVHRGIDAAQMLHEFIRVHGIRVLNVAGPRASSEPGIEQYVKEVRTVAFRLGVQ
jgi:hypothetical protein